MRVRRRALSLVAAVGVLASACSAGSPGAARPGSPADMQLIAALTPFDACGDFLAWVKEAAKARLQPWGLPGVGSSGAVFARDGVAEVGDTAQKASAATPSASPEATTTAPTFSGTNVQEAGVDEPDVWKTDGQRIVAVQGSTLEVVSVSGGGLAPAGRLDLGPGAVGGQLLLSGDKALVVTQDGGLVWGAGKVGVGAVGVGAVGGGVGGAAAADSSVSASALPILSTRIIEVDLSQPAEPRVSATLRVEGSFVDARMVGTTARLVLESSPTKLEFLAPSGPNSEQRARQANLDVIEQSTAEQWLPSYVLEGDGQQHSGQLVDCNRVNHPATFAGFSTLSVLTVDLAKPLTPGDAVAVLGDGQRAYASADNLYVAVNQTEIPPSSGSGAGSGSVDGSGSGDSLPTTAVVPVQPARGPQTAFVHKFSISGSGPATYVASGQVRGHLMDELSMSEYQGDLRVATTDETPTPVAGPQPAAAGPQPAAAGPQPPVNASAPAVSRSPNSESFVTVLRQQGTELVEVGRVGDLGRGERIHAVRFDGAVGYVVTFRQTDPLYTIDLSDPTKPLTRGELALLGYSAYLHPLGGGRVLGVGQDATEQGRITGAQVSLFDVSDLDHPRLVNRVALPAAWANLGPDYHAFLWWAAANLAVVPLEVPPTPADARRFSGLIGFSVQADQLVERGRISHPPAAGGCSVPPQPVPAAPANVVPGESSASGIAVLPVAPPNCIPQFTPPVIRSMVIGDALYSLSAAGIKASGLADLADRSWLSFT